MTLKGLRDNGGDMGQRLAEKENSAPHPTPYSPCENLGFALFQTLQFAPYRALSLSFRKQNLCLRAWPLTDPQLWIGVLPTLASIQTLPGAWVLFGSRQESPPGAARAFPFPFCGFNYFCYRWGSQGRVVPAGQPGGGGVGMSSYTTVLALLPPLPKPASV